MQRQNLIHRVLNMAALLAMLFGLVPPAGATATVPTVPVAPQTATSTAPSALAKAWPLPEGLKPEPFSPFLDPTSLALAEAVRGGIEPELIGNRERLEPLESLTEPGSHLAPLPDKLSPPDNSLLSPANPLDNIIPTLPGPSDLATLANQAEPDEEPLPFMRQQKAMLRLRRDASSLPESGALARPAAVSDTVTTETTGSADDHLIFLPLILKNSDGNSNPEPVPPGDGVLIIPEAGGTLVSSDGKVTLSFRPNGLPETILATMQDDNEAVLPPNFTLLGPKIIVQAEWVNNNQPVQQLDPAAQPILEPGAAKPKPPQPRFWADVIIYLQEGQAEHAGVAITRLDEDSGKWTILPIQINPEKGTATAETDKLGTFALIENKAFTAKNDSISLQAIGDEIIVDDLDLEFQHFTAGPDGTWEAVSCGPGSCWADHAFWTYNRSNFNPGDLNTPWDWATWTPNLPKEGYYYVQAWIPASEEASASDVEYEIHHADGLSIVPVDQWATNGDWKSLGAYRFVVGNSGKVLLDDVLPEKGVGAAQIGFDAMKFIYAGEDPPPDVDLTPPVIHWVNRWLDGNGSAVFRAYVTDNVAVDEVTLIFNGVSVPMTPIGEDLYEAVVSAPTNQINNFQVVTLDASDNAAVFPPGSPIDLRGYLSRRSGWHVLKGGCPPGPCGSGGDPVNTSNGNFTYNTTDLMVAGLGETDIVIERGYNSLPNEAQGIIRYTIDGDTVIEEPFDVHPEPFGPGWTVPFATHLLLIDNILFQGIQVSYPDGRTANFADNGDGTFSPVQPRVFDELMTAGSGYVLKQKDLTSYHFDATGLLTSITDRNDNAINLAYNGEQITSITNASGRTITFDYNGEGLITDIYAPENRHLQYSYQDGLLTGFSDGRTNTTQYQYDPEGRLTAIITPKTHPALRLAYDDGLGRVTEQIIGAAERLTFAYDDDNRVTTITDVDQNQTVHVYDEEYRLIENRDALNWSEHYDYDEDENRTYLKDRKGREYHYTYDDKGNLLTADGPLGWHRDFQYNSLNLVTQITERVDASTTRTTKLGYDGNGNLTTITNALDDTSSIIYDPRGLPTHIFDFNDNETSLTYDPTTGDLSQTQNAEEDTTGFTYDGLGRLRTLTNGRGFVYTYSYDGNDNLTAVAGPLNYHLGYEYDPNNNLRQAIDPNGGETDYSYDTSENLVEVRNQLDFPTFFGYNAMNYLTGLEDAEGRVWTYDYDAVYNRIAAHGPEDTHTFFGYNEVRNVTDVSRCNSPLSGTDCPVKQMTHYDYDDLDRISRVTNPEQHSIDFEYDLVDNLLTLTDARGYPTRFTYDLLDRLILRVDALLGEWEYDYDDEGNLLLEFDANDHPNNAYTYDKANRLLTLTDAELLVTRFSYDENSNLVTLTDGNNNPTSYTYDALDRLDAMTNAEQETTRYHYDLAGNQTHRIEADGIVTLSEYDPIFRLTAVTMNYRPGLAETADINVDTHYGYDKVGNLLSILDAEEHETHFSYDGLNRLVQETDAEDNVWDYEYDRVSNRIARIDANRNRTDYGYYPDNQLRRIDYHDGASVTYTYDENNNWLTMVDHLGTTTWVYDPLNRVTDVTDPFNRHLGYAYDPVSNRTGLTYPDERTVTYTYYDNDWLKTVSDPENNVTSYERDGVGQMTRTINPNSTLTEASYDQANRLLTLTNAEVGGAAKTNSAFSYTYDEVGQRTQMVAEYGWRNPPIVSSDYTYDGLRRLTRDEDSEGVWTEYEFDRVGNRLLLRTNDDSLSPQPFDEKTLLYSYNAINQVLTIVGDTHPGQPSTKREANVGQALYAFRHEVAAQRGKHISEAAADNLLGLVDALLAKLESNPVPKAKDVAAAIESLRQQVLAHRAGGAIDSDGIANSLLVKLDKGDEANSDTAGDLQTTTFSYDANGNRINKEFPGPQGPQVQGTDYTYDPENRLVVAQDYQMNNQGNRVDRAVTSLDYDGSGRRLVKEYDPKTGNSGQKRIEYVFDGLDPVAEYNIWNPQYDNFYRGDLGRILTMQHFPSGPQAQGQMYWYHYDGLGSVSGLTKQNGNSHHNYRYEPYGQLEMPPGNFTDPHNHYTFTGQELDENMGLYEFYARAYDYDTGTWVQQDVYRGMIGEPRSLHRYGYVNANPTNLIDKYGYYERDTHRDLTYDLTYQAALAEGLDVDQAAAIAYYMSEGNYGMDDLKHAAFPRFWTDWAKLHFKNRDDVESNYLIPTINSCVPLLESDDMDRYGDFAKIVDFGRRLHMYQDSYSHVGYTLPGGHAWDSLFGDNPDAYDPSSDREQEMLSGTYDWMRKFIAANRDYLTSLQIFRDQEPDQEPMPGPPRPQPGPPPRPMSPYLDPNPEYDYFWDMIPRYQLNPWEPGYVDPYANYG